MVIGLLAITAIPTVVGVGQALSAQKKQNEDSKETAKFGVSTAVTLLDVHAEATCVLSNGQLWLQHPAVPSPSDGHAFSGFYFTYPGSEPPLRGLVSSIQDDPPLLNWIYIDADARALRYGSRSDSLGHVVGPWGWSDDERRLVVRGSDAGFVAVQQEGSAEGMWALFWDPDGLLRAQLAPGQRWVEVKLGRKMALGMESKYVRDNE